MTRSRADQLAAERWFLEQGLPSVLPRRALLRRVWSRSAPALSAFAVVMAISIAIVAMTGKHSIDVSGAPTRAQWFELAMVVLVLPAATFVGWWVSRVANHRAQSLISAGALIVAGLGAAFGGPFTRIALDVVLDVVIIVAIFVGTATGFGSILGWALRMTLEHVASMGTLLVRALPVMLLTVLVFFNGPVWTMAAIVSRDRLDAALLFLLVIAATFLVSTTLSRVRPALRQESLATVDPRELNGTPFENMPDGSAHAELSLAERVNGTVVLILSQIVQVMTVAVATGLLFFVFGLILISPELLEALTHGGSPDGQILGMTLPVPQALIHVTMFLTALTFMYLAARAVSDEEYRAQFLDPLLETLRLTMVARNRYRLTTGDSTWAAADDGPTMLP